MQRSEDNLQEEVPDTELKLLDLVASKQSTFTHWAIFQNVWF